ncbi:MAG: hypothetical protein ACKVGZ_14875, partial [Alphaproteobacteria bacterium]
WEAIAGEVPLVLSRKSGLWKLLVEAFGSNAAHGLVRDVDARGQEGDDQTENFRSEDETDVKNIILDLAADPYGGRKPAKDLKQRLIDEFICTWEHTAKQFVEGLGDFASDAEATPAAKAPVAATSDVISIPSSDWPVDFGGPM